jgi:TonB family protein
MNDKTPMFRLLQQGEEQAFNDLLGESARLLSAEDYNSERWDAMVHRFLERPDLGDPAVRERLEARLVHWFHEGWQPGKDLLLAAVAKAFGWQEDGRLEIHGKAGILVRNALEEYAHFRRQATPTLNTQWAAIRHMREGVGTDLGRLRRSLYYFRTLHANYPAWLHMAASKASIQEWAAIGAKAPEQLQREYKEGAGIKIMYAFLFVLATTFIGERLFGPQPQTRPRIDRADYYVPQAGDFMPSREWINDTIDRIEYRSAAGARLVEQPGIFTVTLTKLGNVENVEVTQASADPAFDQAAVKAIRQSPGFSSDIARKFRLTLYPR